MLSFLSTVIFQYYQRPMFARTGRPRTLELREGTVPSGAAVNQSYYANTCGQEFLYNFGKRHSAAILQGNVQHLKCEWLWAF